MHNCSSTCSPAFAPCKDWPQGIGEAYDEERQQNHEAREGVTDHRQDLCRMIPELSKANASDWKLFSSKHNFSQAHAGKYKRHLQVRDLESQFL